jgi:nucleotide-binding universal stress UspA family protein
MQKAVRRLVVGFDGSELAQRALKTACELVQPDGVVTVVNAYDVPWQADAYPWFEDFKDVCRDVAEEALESAKEVCREYPVTATFKTAVGKPADVLAQLAQSEDAELIVVGTRGLGAVRGAIGSVTYRLLHRAHCPVLVVTEPEPELESERDAATEVRTRGTDAP